MFEQHSSSHSPTAPPDSWPGDAVILDWIDGWHPVREDVLQLLEAYRVSDAGHDIGSFLPLIDEVDTAMRLLQHRVSWLRNYLGRTVEESVEKR
jgi:hypothetical protein